MGRASSPSGDGRGMLLLLLLLHAEAGNWGEKGGAAPPAVPTRWRPRPRNGLMSPGTNYRQLLLCGAPGAGSHRSDPAMGSAQPPGHLPRHPLPSPRSPGRSVAPHPFPRSRPRGARCLPPAAPGASPAGSLPPPELPRAPVQPHPAPVPLLFPMPAPLRCQVNSGLKTGISG